MTIEIVDFPMKNGGSSHSYVNVYQMVDTKFGWCTIAGKSPGAVPSRNMLFQSLTERFPITKQG